MPFEKAPLFKFERMVDIIRRVRKHTVINGFVFTMWNFGPVHKWKHLVKYFNCAVA